MRTRTLLSVALALLFLLGSSGFNEPAWDVGETIPVLTAQPASVEGNSSPQHWGLAQTLTGQTDYVANVAFSPDGSLLASDSDNNSIRIWDTSDWTEVQTLTGHTDWLSSLTFSPDGTLLASGSADLTVRIWDTSDWTEVRILTGHAGLV